MQGLPLLVAEQYGRWHSTLAANPAGEYTSYKATCGVIMIPERVIWTDPGTRVFPLCQSCYPDHPDSK